MDPRAVLFYLFSVVTVFAALRVITARNPVHSALFLVLTFCSAACIWILLKAEFLAITLVLVYVGAVMVLFLFVVMMLDINLDQVRQGFWRNLPVALLVGVVVVIELAMVLMTSFRVRQSDVPPLPAPNLHPKVEQVPDYFGDVQRGAALYATSCYGCHGAEGHGRVPPNFPGFTYSRETFRQVVSTGAGGPTMPGFGPEAGGPLSASDLEDLETYVASWSIEPPKAAPSPEGWSTFLVILGVLAVLAVGGYYGGGFSLSSAFGSENDSVVDDSGEQP